MPVWWNEFMPIHVKPSMLAAAELPAMTTDPNEFTDDWMMTLEIENMQPWMPAGRPILTMFFSSSA